MVVEDWVKIILKDYPIKIAEVENYIREAAEKIVDNVLKIFNGEKFDSDFEDAVHDLMRFLATDRKYKPSESLSLMLILFDLLKDELKLNDKDQLKLLKSVFEVTLLAFDYYVKCRDKIYELRLKQKDQEIEILKKIVFYSSKP